MEEGPGHGDWNWEGGEGEAWFVIGGGEAGWRGAMIGGGFWPYVGYASGMIIDLGMGVWYIVARDGSLVG